MRAFVFGLMISVAVCIANGPASAEEAARFHHISVNAVDPEASVKWYQKFFDAVPVDFNGNVPAVLTDRSFVFFEKVDEPAPWKMESGIYHIGWGGVNGPADFEWRDREGVEWETPLSTLGTNHFMYAYGPDKEVIEVWTGFKHHRFGHVHLFSNEVNEAKKWYMKHLGLDGPAQDAPKPPKAPDNFQADPDQPFAIFQYLWASQVSTDNDVTINIFAAPSKDSVIWWPYEEGVEDIVPTDGRVIDHIAFSYRDVEAAYERMKAEGVEIVKPLAERPDHGYSSFFVRGPDKVLIEIVEAKPIPEASWE